LAPPYYSQREVFASPPSAFSFPPDVFFLWRAYSTLPDLLAGVKEG